MSSSDRAHWWMMLRHYIAMAADATSRGDEETAQIYRVTAEKIRPWTNDHVDA
jgi:hypothetical protein